MLGVGLHGVREIRVDFREFGRHVRRSVRISRDRPLTKTLGRRATAATIGGFLVIGSAEKPLFACRDGGDPV